MEDYDSKYNMEYNLETAIIYIQALRLGLQPWL